MNDQTLNVLFLCTGNSARSILAECILNREGKGRFKGYSAGSHPTGKVHPLARALLERRSFPTEDLRSKSWDEFTGPDAPEIDFVITVCDNAAGEACPIFPGHSLKAHWGLPDPAAAKGTPTEQALAFAETFRMLSSRINTLVNLTIDSSDRIGLQQKLDEIGTE